MSDHKNELIREVNNSVQELYGGNVAGIETTESGFFCDYDLSEPFNPEKIALLDRDIRNRYNG